jgi:hypothetical protein
MLKTSQFSCFCHKEVWSFLGGVCVCECFQTYRGATQGSVLSPMLFSMIMYEIVRRKTEGRESGIP